MQSKQEIKERIEKKSLLVVHDVAGGLTWEDWCYATKNRLVLRHVTPPHDIKKEQEIGGVGDACSLVISDLIVGEDLNDVNLNDKDFIDTLTKRFECTSPSFVERANLNFHFKIFLETKDIKEKKERLTALFNFMLYDWIEANHSFIESEHIRFFKKNSDHYYLILPFHKGQDSRVGYDTYPLGTCGREGFTPPSLTVYLKYHEHSNISNSLKTIASAIQGMRKNLLVENPLKAVKRQRNPIQLTIEDLVIVEPREYPSFKTFPLLQRKLFSDLLTQLNSNENKKEVKEENTTKEVNTFFNWKTLVVGGGVLALVTAAVVYTYRKK